MLDDPIQQLLASIQKLSDDQLKAIQDAVYVGMTPTVAGECEFRRELISKLVDKLTELSKHPSIDPTPHKSPNS